MGPVLSFHIILVLPLIPYCRFFKEKFFPNDILKKPNVLYPSTQSRLGIFSWVSWIRYRRDQMTFSLISHSPSQYSLVAARITSKKSGNLTPFPKAFTLPWLYSQLQSLCAFLKLAEGAWWRMRSRLTSFLPAGLLTPTKAISNLICTCNFTARSSAILSDTGTIDFTLIHWV